MTEAAMNRPHHGTEPRGRRPWLLSLVALLGGCTGLPEGVEPVGNFDADRYLGTWYEIARLDHSFERGLTRVTAQYAARDDGGIDVLNRGYDAGKGEWEEARGRAYFVRDRDEGYLKVSFFGPFYGAYVVFGLDRAGYAYSYVSGPNRKYLWLLARQPTVEQAVIDGFVERARGLGYPVDQLIFVEQTALAAP